MPQIRMVWWDYGGVLFDQLSDERFESLSKLAIPREEPFVIHSWLRISGLVQLYDLGEIDTDQFFEKVGRLIGCENRQKIIGVWTRTIKPNRMAWKLTARIMRNGYLQGIISNTNELHACYAEKRMAERISHFRPRIYSFREGLEKPNPKIFRLALEQARQEYRQRFKPEECVFIDDLAENVEAAKRSGWYAFQHNPQFVTKTASFLLTLGIRL